MVETLSTGYNPYWVAYDSADNALYVTNELPSGTVTVISAATGAIETTIPVGDDPIGIAYDSITGDLYVANVGSDVVDVISGATNGVVGTVTFASPCWGLVFDPEIGDLYCSHYGGNTITELLAPGNTVGTSINVQNTPSAMVYDPANGNIYVGNYGSGSVSIVDPTTNTVLATPSTGGFPFGVAYDSVNNDVYTSTLSGDTVSVIGGATNAVVATIDVENNPAGIVYDPQSDEVYVTNDASGELSVINPTSNTVTYAFSLGLGASSEPSYLAFDSTNDEVYATEFASAALAVVSSQLGVGALSPSLRGTASVGTLQANPTNVGAFPYGIALDPDSGDLYVANNGEGAGDTVSVLSGANNSLISHSANTIVVGSSPYGVAYDSSNGLVYVTCFASNSLSVINPANESLISHSPNTITGVVEPISVAYDPANGYLYVVGFDGDLYAINGATDVVTATVAIPVDALGIVYDPVNGELYVGTDSGDQVEVVSPATLQSLGTITTGGTPSALAYDPANQDIYTANMGSSSLSVISGANNSLISHSPNTIAVEAFPTGIVYDADNAELFVSNVAEYSLQAVSTATGAVVGNYAVGNSMFELAFDPANGNVYGANFGNSQVDIISTLSSATSNPSASTDLGQLLVLELPLAGQGAGGDVLSVSVYPEAGLSCLPASAGLWVDSATCLPTSAGTYTVSFTVEDELQTSLSASILITVDPDVTVALPPATPDSLDLGQSTTLEAAPTGGAGSYTYAWSGLPVGCSTANSPILSCSPTAVEGGPFSIRVTVTDSNGYSAVSAATVLTVYSDPGVTFCSGPCLSEQNSVDVGQTLLFTAATSGGTGSFSYVWSGLPKGCTTANDPTLSCTPTAPDIGALVSVVVTVTDTNGVSAQSPSFAISVYPDPTIQPITVSRGTLDAGQSLTLSTTASVGSGSPTYAWTGLPAGCPNTGTLSVSCNPSVTGTFSIVASVKDSDGFTANSTVAVVVVSALPTITSLAASTVVLDVGQPLVFEASGTTGSGGLQFDWTGLPTGCAGSPSWTISCSPSAPGTLSSIDLTVTDSNGGSALRGLGTSVTVWADPVLQPVTASRSTLDVSQGLTLTTSSTLGSGSDVYSWAGLPTGCFSTNSASIACSPTAAGSFSVVAHVDDGDGMNVSSTSLLVVVSPLPSITSLTASVFSLDVGQSTVLSATGTSGGGGLTYTWTGLPAGCSGASSWTVTCVPTGAGSASALLAVTDSNGGSATWPTPTSITVYADPTITTPAASRSALDVGQASTISSISSAPAGSPSYTWSGLPSGCTGTTTLTVTCRPTAGSEGTYTISVSVTDANGVAATSGTMLLSVSALPTLTGLTASTSSLDVGQGITFTATGTSGSGGDTYAWSGLPLGCSGAAAWSFGCTPSAAGASSTTLVVTDSNGGSATWGTAVSTVVYADPTISTPTSSPTSIDLGQTTVISALASAPAGGAVYSWTGLPAGCTGLATLTVTCTPGAGTAGTYGAFATVVDANGVSATSPTLTLAVSPLPSITSLSASKALIDVGQVVTLSATGTVGSGSLVFAWTGLPAGCTGVNAWTFACAPAASGSYSVLLSVSDSNGGSASWTTAATFVVVSDPTAPAPVASPAEVDVGQTLGLSAHAGAGSGSDVFSWWGLPSGCLSADLSTLACAPTFAGSYSVGYSVQDSDGVNVSSSPVGIDVSARLGTPALSASSGLVDTGGSVTFSAVASGGDAPYSYAWSGLPTGCASEDQESLLCVPTSAGAFSVSVTVADSSGGSQTSSAVALQVTTPPSVGVPSATRSSLDIGQTTSLTVVAVANTKTSSLVWYGLPAGCTSANSTTLACAPSAAGVYAVWATLTDANGISATSPSLTLSVAPALGTPTLTPSATTIDLGASLTFASSVQGGSGGYQYVWSGLPVGCVGADLASVTCTPTSTGSTTASVAVTDSNGAAASATASITVNAALTVSVAASPSSAQSGTTLEFTADAAGGSGSLTYSWFLNGSVVASASSSTLTLTDAKGGTYTAWVEVTDSTGAKVSSAPVTVLVASPVSTAPTTPASSSTVTAQVSPLEEYALIGMLLLLVVIAVLLAALLMRRGGTPDEPEVPGPRPPAPPAEGAPATTKTPATEPAASFSVPAGPTDPNDYHEN